MHGDRKEAKPAPAETRTLASITNAVHKATTLNLCIKHISKLHPNKVQMKSLGIQRVCRFKFSERGMIHEEYIRTLFFLISLCWVLKQIVCPEIYITADRHVKDVNAFPFIP
jgi:hypothetical protein